MSKIDKLSILGVRSFDNIRSETIQFHTPLTLIVGYNGSGKTTIIECLKYATTGQLPPNSKGGAFIHDPKLCGEKEVLAQVKLSFKDHQNARLVVTRSLQLTVKKTTRSVKTLEGNLLMVKDGERTTMSTRVAELDQMMPQLLGVGEAILDNVIFCHQDESLWPMSEPAVLKKKFDEIFEALKYTKAIDNIKVVRKNQGAELQKHKIMEEQFKIEKDRGERAEKKSIQLSDEIEALRKQSEELNAEMQKALDGARAKHEQAREYQEIIVNLGNKRQQAESRREAVDELKENIEELEESDEWLESTLAQYQETMEMYRLEEETYRGNYRDLQKDLEDCRTQMWEKMAERGQIQADNEAHDRQLREREELVKNAARKHQVRGFEGELDDELIQTFVERMGKLARDKDRELEKLQQTNEEGAREAQAAVNDLLNQRSTRTQDRVTARQAITSNDRRISGLQNEASAIKIDEGAKAVLDEQERELRDKHREATESFQHADYDAKSRKENSKLRELEDENSNLNDQLIRSTQMAQDRAQLDLKKKELKDRETRLYTLVDTHRDKLKSIVGDTWNPSSVDRDFSASLKLRNTAVQEARSKRDSTSQDLQQVEYRLSTARNTHKRKLVEMKACEKAVLNSITTDDGGHLHSVADYLPELQQLEDDRQTLKSDIDNYAHLNEFWTGCLKAAEEKNLCKVCERPFQGSQEKSQTVTKLRKRIAKEAKELLEQEIKEVEVQLNDARAVRSQYETCQRLAEEIKPLEKDIEQADEQRTNLLSQLDEQDAVVRIEEEAKMDTEALSKPVGTISRLEGEVTEYSKEVARISSQQSSTGSAYLTLVEIQEKLATCSEETRSVKNRIAAITRDKDQARNTVNSLELQLRDIATKIMNAGHQIREKMTLLQRIDEFKESNLTQQETIRSVDAELEALAPKLASAQAKLGDVKERGRTKEKAINDDSLRLTETVNQLRRVHNAITAYIDKGGPSMMEHCQNEISDLEKEIARIEGKIAEVTAKANKLKEQVDNSEKTKRNISDNIRYRRNVRALEILHAEIAELESRNAHEDERRLSAEARRLDMRYQKLLADRGPVLGQMRAKDQELQGHIKDWETDYKDAARKYRESHIKVETTKAAIEDLARYGNALDQAIMKYHSMKMEEINRIAGELWQSTYQGTDIDTILIRSDAENATLKRNYNYRVCMVKQDAEMDMRGRCSAGQRVLASIIIRLALAECFGINCGLIALDEPTTNLDVDNIKALAVSLHAIINTRMAQSNFQLIVITHDEEFLKYMKCADFCDNYYRVSRDDKQKSIIEKQNITDIL